MSHFQTFLSLAGLYRGMSDTPFQGKAFDVHWTLWIDPGVHTGLAAVLYATPIGDETAIQLAERLDKTLRSINVAASPRGAGLPGDHVPGAPGATGAVICGIWTELLFDDERAMTRTAISRVRALGKTFSGIRDWDTMTGEVPGDDHPHIGAAGIGAERFVVLKPERDADYLSPERVRSMFSYALEDEFGIDMAGQMPGDAKNVFTDDRLRNMGLYQKGSDHPRDALRHALLAIRKTVLS